MKQSVQNWSNSDTIGNIYKSVKQIDSKRQSKTWSKYQRELTSWMNPVVSKCNTSKCRICCILIEGNLVHFPDFPFHIRSNMSCVTMNCVYVIKSGGCHKFYVRESINFCLRTNVRKDHVRNGTSLYVNKHIHACTLPINEQEKILIMPFYKVKKSMYAEEKILN